MRTAAVVSCLLLAACQSTPNAPPVAPKPVPVPGQALERISSYLRACRLKSGPLAGYRLVDERDSYSDRPRLLLARRGQERGLPRLVVQTSRAKGLEIFGPLATAKLTGRLRSAALGRTAC